MSTALKYFHYLAIACAGNDIVINHEDLVNHPQEQEALMLSKYEEWVERIGDAYPEWNMPDCKHL